MQPDAAHGAPAGDDVFLHGVRSESLSALGRHIEPNSAVALLDVPNQRNVGDSLIYAGESAHLRNMGLSVRYLADLGAYTPRRLRQRLAPGSGTILLHGGGNFGDLWEGHQLHREAIVREFADYKIVQLPQSVYFRSADRARLANDTLAQHPDFRLLVRDDDSMDRVRTQLPDLTVDFCPDMALGWSPPRRGQADRTDPRAIILARADKERSSDLADVGADWLPGLRCVVTDWNNRAQDMPAWEEARRQTGRAAQAARLERHVRLPGFERRQSGLERSIESINAINIQGGVELFSPAEVIVVDRLHAHILAGLMGIKHVLLDNNYGKLGAVFSKYSHQFSTARRATTLDEARQAAIDLLHGD